MSGFKKVQNVFAVIYGILLILFGMYNLLMNWTNLTMNDAFIANADMVVGECTMAGAATDSKDSYLKITVKYVYEGKRYDNIVIDDYGQFYLKGDKVNLFVDSDDPTKCVIRYSTSEGDGYKYTVFTLMGFLLGGSCLFVGIVRLKRGSLF